MLSLSQSMCCKKNRSIDENHPSKNDKKKRNKGKDDKNEKEPLEQNHGTLNNTISKKQQDAMENDLIQGSPVVVPDAQEMPQRTRAEKCASCCKKFVAFLFSTIGLTCVLCGYTIFGGFVFMWLESPNEVQLKNDVQITRKFYVERLWNLTYDLNLFHPQNWSDMANRILQDYTTEVYLATKHKGWDGNDGETELQWTFAGSLLYSITVITTIGYGHIAPKTDWGKIVTMIYAVFGIPICVLTLTNLGGFMATAFRFIYHKICCGFCCLCCICCQLRCRKSASTGLSASTKYRDPKNGEAGASVPLGPDAETGGKSPKSKKVPLRVYWTHGIQRAMKTDDNATLSVPMYVSLCLIAGYIMAGALMFSLWEDQWSFLVGYYFCFITLSTIGFGDYVPGTSLDNWDSQEKLVLVALYLLFGLALCAMCFDLMQEEARNKVKYIAKKMGLIKDEKKEEKKKKKEILKSASSQLSDNPIAVDG